MSETKIPPESDQGLEPESDPANQQEIESQKITGEFNQSFDTWFDKHRGSVEREALGDSLVTDTLVASLTDGNQRYRVVFTEVVNRPSAAVAEQQWPSEDLSRAITVNQLSGPGVVKTSSYRLGRDDIVRRFDSDSRRSLLREEMEQKHLAWSADAADYQKRHQQNQKDQIENQRLEEKMGFNNQPVSLEEVGQLGQFLDRFNQPAEPPQPQSEYDPSGLYI